MTTATLAACSDASIAAQKQDLRAQILAARRAMPPASRSRAAAQICKRLLALPELAAARCVAAFMPMKEEVDIRPLLNFCCKTGKTVALPRVCAPRKLQFHAVDRLELLSAGYKDILEPPADLPSVSPEKFDFAIVPAVAIDSAKNRLGYGGGFYDIFLKSLNRAAKSCAPVFGCQRVVAVPRAPHDMAVDMVFSERRDR